MTEQAKGQVIPGLTIVRKPLETYLIVRESDGDRELTAAECQTLYDAHTEIARLRVAVRDQAGVELSEENDRLIDEITSLRAQRDQLREALERIGRATGHADKVVCLLTIDEMAKFARAAIVAVEDKP